MAERYWRLLSLVVCGILVAGLRLSQAASAPAPEKRPSVDDSTGPITVRVEADSSIHAMSKEAITKEKGKQGSGLGKDCVVLACKTFAVRTGGGDYGAGPPAISFAGDVVLEGGGFAAKAHAVLYTPATGAVVLKSEGPDDVQLLLQRSGEPATSMICAREIAFRRGGNEVHVKGLLPGVGPAPKSSSGPQTPNYAPQSASVQVDGSKAASPAANPGSDGSPWNICAENGAMRLKATQVRLAAKADGWSCQLEGKAAMEVGDFRAAADKIEALSETKGSLVLRLAGDASIADEDFRATADSIELVSGSLRMTAREGKAARFQRTTGGAKVQIEASSIQFDAARRRVMATGATTVDLGP